MKAYLEYIRISLKLAQRDRVTIFFNYIFPLVFFVIFAQAYHAGQGGAIVQVVTMVLIIGILGSGFFGAGVRSVQEREMNILRRFKVAPITPLPILVASMVTGFLTYMPTVIAVLAIAHFHYGMRVPSEWPSLLVFAGLGILAFRAVGLIVASVVNSMQESQILVQLLYLPMLFLSGATFPVSELPDWLQIVAQFMPATYLYTGMQGILFRHEGLITNWLPVLGLVVTGVLATFIGVKLFRWEKEEKPPAANKAWLLAVLAPFLIIGGYQTYSLVNVAKARILYRELHRSRTMLIQDARIFTGDGTILNHGAVLIRDGKIARIYSGAVPSAASLQAEALEASGKTLLPGLIDVNVHLSASGGLYPNPGDFQPSRAIPRELAAYLYSGVTTVRSSGDPPGSLEKTRERLRTGERLGAGLLLAATLVRLPQTPQLAREQVHALAGQAVDAIRLILDSASAAPAVLAAVVGQAHADRLSVTARTSQPDGVSAAIAAGVDTIEHGSASEPIPDALFLQMQARNITYDPALSATEAAACVREHSPRLLDRSLVEQVGPASLLAATRRLLPGVPLPPDTSGDLDLARENLKRAWKAGVRLVTGTGSGNLLLVHGPALHHELQLWVEAGLPASVALQAATGNAARLLLRQSDIGVIAPGREATLRLVDGNPAEDIAATERISSIFFRGERIDRAALFDQQ